MVAVLPVSGIRSRGGVKVSVALGDRRWWRPPAWRDAQSDSVGRIQLDAGAVPGRQMTLAYTWAW